MDTRLRPVRHEIEEADANLLSLIKDTWARRRRPNRATIRNGGSFSKIVQTHESTGGFDVTVPRTIRLNKTRDAQKPEAGQRRNIIRLVYLLCYLQ